MVSTTTSTLDPVPSTRVWKSSTIFHAIKQSVILNFGDAGWGAVGVSLSVKYYSPTTQTCIIKVGREHVRIARGAITLLTNIEGVGVLPVVLCCSGTIKKLQIASVEHNRDVIARFHARVAEDSGELVAQTSRVSHTLVTLNQARESSKAERS